MANLSEVALMLITQVFIVLTLILSFGWVEQLGGLGSEQQQYPFNWHPILMIFAFALCESEAIIAYAVIPLQKYHQKLIHTGLHIVAVILMSAAVGCVFTFHNDNWVGMIVFVLFIVQLVLSFIIFLYPGAEERTRKALINTHRIVGGAIYIGLIMTGMMGVLEKQTFIQKDPKVDKFGDEAKLANFLALCFPIVGILVGIQVYQRHWKNPNAALPVRQEVSWAPEEPKIN